MIDFLQKMNKKKECVQSSKCETTKLKAEPKSYVDWRWIPDFKDKILQDNGIAGLIPTEKEVWESTKKNFYSQFPDSKLVLMENAHAI